MNGINAYRSITTLIEARPNSSVATKDVAASDARKLDKATGDFEALFINHMLKTMRESSMKNSLFDGGKGEEIYTSMLDQELSTIMSSGEGIGLKKALISQLLNQISSGEPGKDIKGARLESIKPVLNNPGALKEFQSHLKTDEFRSPVAGKISSGYGMRKNSVTGMHEMHRGIDISAPEGTPVYPTSSGEVIFSGAKEGYGNLVEIRHDNGYISRYGNNNELRARTGERVNPYDIISLVGNGEGTTGAHLHFETVVEGFAVNPVDLVNFN